MSRDRYAQCDDTCTVDCGACKGAGRPPEPGDPQQAAAEVQAAELRVALEVLAARPGSSGQAAASVSWHRRYHNAWSWCQCGDTNGADHSDAATFALAEAARPGQELRARVTEALVEVESWDFDVPRARSAIAEVVEAIRAALDPR